MKSLLYLALAIVLLTSWRAKQYSVRVTNFLSYILKRWNIFGMLELIRLIPIHERMTIITHCHYVKTKFNLDSVSTLFVRGTWGRGCTRTTCRRQLGEDGGKPCLWGDFAWQPFHISYGTSNQQRPPRTLYPPERLSSQMEKCLHQWTAAECWTGPMVSCQQEDFVRSQGA